MDPGPGLNGAPECEHSTWVSWTASSFLSQKCSLWRSPVLILTEHVPPCTSLVLHLFLPLSTTLPATRCPPRFVATNHISPRTPPLSRVHAALKNKGTDMAAEVLGEPTDLDDPIKSLKANYLRAERAHAEEMKVARK